eukprot:COSAG04_NODE_305_length_17292_cov_72.482173_12_plen_95_part_00
MNSTSWQAHGSKPSVLWPWEPSAGAVIVRRRKESRCEYCGLSVQAEESWICRSSTTTSVHWAKTNMFERIRPAGLGGAGAAAAAAEPRSTLSTP